MYATQWGILLAIVCFIVVWQTCRLELVMQRQNNMQSLIQDNPNNFTQYQATNLKFRLAKNSRLASIIQHIALSLQFSITFVFWVFVAPVFLVNISFWSQVGLIVSHTLPIGLLVYHYFSTKSTIELGDWWHNLLVTLFYLAANYAYTLERGSPVYPFMTWNDPYTLVYCLSCWLFGQLCTVLCAYLQKLTLR